LTAGGSRLVAAAVLLLATGVYAGAAHNGFALDDVPIVLEDPGIRSVAGLPGLLTADYWEPTVRAGLYRPLVKLSLAFNFAVGGDTPRGYHLVNVALHVGVSLLVLLLARRVSGGDEVVAAGAAALFAAHAVHTEAVANVVGRGELLCSAFFLAAVLAYAAAREREGSGARRLLALGAGAHVLALLSKESAVTLPGVLVLYDLCLAPGGPSDLAGRARALLRRDALRRYAPFLGVTALYLGVRALVLHDVQPTDELDNPLVALAAPLRAANALALAWRSLGLLLLPLQLSYDYSYGSLPVFTTLTETRALAAPAALLALAVALAWSWRRARALCFAMGFVAVTFSLVSNVALPIGTILGERLLYLPSVGFCLAVALALRGACARWLPGRAAPAAFAALLVAAVGLNAWLTVRRVPLWASDETIMLSGLEDQPGSAKVRHNAGVIFLERGEVDRAVVEMQRAVAIHPGYGRAHASLGHALVRQGRRGEATESYMRARDLGWSDARTANNLGFLLIEADRELPFAVALIEAAVREEPGNASYLDSLGVAYLRQGRAREALPLLERALAAASNERERASRLRHVEEAQRALAGAER